MRTIVAATLVHQSLKLMGLCKKIPVSDVWLTVTCRIETIDLHFARDHVRGVGGVLLDVSPSNDGLATIARYRMPLESDVDTHSLIEVENVESSFSGTIDVGLRPWADESSEDEYNLPTESTVSILGVGGLGSWAAPLICDALSSGIIHIIDGDEEVALHNLNRQVLYGLDDIDKPKARVARENLEKHYPDLQIHSHELFLARCHLSEPAEDGFDLNDAGGDDELRSALRSSDISLGCLDNMHARTILNEAALLNKIPMINGGGESTQGVVERLFDEGCMICRYGAEAANATEVISCTEEGVRPITSIVTTTAWVGAMMAALTILELSGSTLHSAMRYSWFDGNSDSTMVSKPPWYDEECIRHF